MKWITVLGILLIVLGVLAFAYGGIRYSHEKRLVDIGPIHATREVHERIPIPPAIGGIAFAGGVVMILIGVAKP